VGVDHAHFFSLGALSFCRPRHFGGHVVHPAQRRFLFRLTRPRLGMPDRNSSLGHRQSSKFLYRPTMDHRQNVVFFHVCSQNSNLNFGANCGYATTCLCLPLFRDKIIEQGLVNAQAGAAGRPPACRRAMGTD
jgi:hypothetical protein